jgi:hypothetical protein
MEGRSNKVLSKQLTQTMLSPVLDGAGLGVFLETKGGRKYFGHGGANEGFRCQYYGSLEGGNGVVVMVNSDNGNIIPEIINSVATVYNWTGFITQVSKQIVPVHADTLSKYTGTYTLEGITLTITQKDNALYLRQNDSEPVKMYFTSNRDFFIMEVNAESQFQKNDDGIVDTIVINQGGRVFNAKRKL